jgi:hypothetical protein
MPKIMKKLLFLIYPLFIISCSQAPKCDDEQVVQYATDIITKKLRYEIAYQKYYNEKIEVVNNSYVAQEFIGAFSSIVGMSSQEAIDKSIKIARKDIQAIIDGEKDAGTKYIGYINFADSVIVTSELYINNIRIQKVDGEVKLCNCMADVNGTIAGDKLKEQIEYTAQYSEDGILTVKVNLND